MLRTSLFWSGQRQPILNGYAVYDRWPYAVARPFVAEGRTAGERSAAGERSGATMVEDEAGKISGKQVEIAPL
jgi:hypothetical protein